MNEIRIAYTPRKKLFFLIILFFSACAAIIAFMASINDQRILLYDTVELSVQSASMLLWGVAAMAMVFVLIGVWVLLKSVFNKREIVITDRAITAPKSGISNKIVTVEFSDIESLDVEIIQKTKIFCIYHSAGKLTIPDSMLPGENEFSKLVHEIKLRTMG